MGKPLNHVSDVKRLRDLIHQASAGLADTASGLTKECFMSCLGEQVKTAALHGSDTVRISLDFTINYKAGTVAVEQWTAAVPSRHAAFSR